MRNIKLTVSYDGTGYNGFQKQSGTGLPTIQEILENVISKQMKREITVVGASRTDSGVHALGQVVNFNGYGWGIPTERIPLALNSLLPDDIVVKKAEDVGDDFHARFSAKGKKYKYKVYNSRIPDPFMQRYSLFEARSLDLEAMREAAEYLKGTHDFTAFKAEGTPVKSAVRTLFSIDIDKSGPIVDLVFTGDGFLYNMVRILTGTLLDIGLGKYPPAWVKKVLESGKRPLAGQRIVFS